MTRLKATQLRGVNDTILELYEDGAEPFHLERIVDGLARLFPGSRISADEAVAPGTIVRRAGRGLETIPQVNERIARYCGENPVVAYVLHKGFTPVLRVSDFVTFRQAQRMAFYNEMLCFLTGWRDQAAIAMQLPTSTLGIGLNRDKAYSDEERLMMELLQPHIERLLRRCIQYLRLQSERPLSGREREVLHWVAEGKRDSEIAGILGVGERTIEQHVRSVLKKLTVETRTAAAAAVWRARACMSEKCFASVGKAGRE